VPLSGAIAFSSLAAQVSHPDLSGTWILDHARSDSSSFTPASATFVVRQLGDSMVLDRDTPGTGHMHLIYTFDGSARVNTLRLVDTAVAATSTAEWHADTLVVHTTSEAGGGSLVQRDSWWLGPEAATLRIRREATYEGAPIGSPTLVFVRRPG